MEAEKKHILIIGIGNNLLKDEEVGIHVIERMAAIDLPEGIELIDGQTEGASMAYLIEGREKVIAVTSLRGGGVPGSIYRLAESDMREGRKGSRRTIEEQKFLDQIMIARALGTAPAEVIVIGVEPEDTGEESLSLEIGLSPAVEQKVPVIIAMVMQEIKPAKAPPPHEETKPVLILGIGNLLLRDEGVGVHIVEDMRRMSLPPHVELMDGGTMGIDLLYYIEGRKKVIVVDTVKGEHPPGTLYRFTDKNLAIKKPLLRTAHGIDFTDVVVTAQRLGTKPEEIVFIGVEPEDMEEGMELSPLIKSKMPKIIELVMREVGKK